MGRLMAKRGRPRKIVETKEPVETFEIVWLGEDTGEMRETVWNKVRFLRGVPTEVSDHMMIRKARGSRFYEVIE